MQSGMNGFLCAKWFRYMSKSAVENSRSLVQDRSVWGIDQDMFEKKRSGSCIFRRCLLREASLARNLGTAARVCVDLLWLFILLCWRTGLIEC